MTGARVARFLQRCIAALSGDVLTLCTAASSDPARSAPLVDGGPPTLGEITLLPHQVDGARLLAAVLDVHGGALLADEVGLGKTYTALRVARDYSRVLIVAPAALRSMWEVACHRTRVSAECISYERISAGNFPRAGHWDLVILDEAHHARSRTTKRYAALCGLTRGARVLLLTATPIHNRPSDLQALLALFLGAGAERLDDAALSALVVRRRERDLEQRLPALGALLRHSVPHADGVLPALRALPPPLPPADGGLAHALVILQLTRAWCSSDAALLAAIRNRLATATALEQALARGRLPSRRDLSAWSAGSDGSVQLAFPELVAAPAARGSADAALAVVRDHAESLRALRSLVRGPAARDHARMAALVHLLHARAPRKAIVFTHSTVTAELAFRTLRGRARVALLTGRGACIASGPIPRAEVLRQFAPDGCARADPNSPTDVTTPPDPLRIDVLVASDVVSEGVDLQRAGIVVHLDLPWTVARLEQRIGRVRRMGSAHATVESHLVTPPVGADELQVTLTHLVRKATLAGRTVGRSSLIGDPEVWAGVLPATPLLAPATVRRALIDTLRALEQLTRPAISVGSLNVRGADSDCPSIARSSIGSDRPAVVRWRILRQRAPCGVALVTLAGVPHLIFANGDEVTIDPLVVVERLASVVEHARGDPRLGASVSPARVETCLSRRGVHASADTPIDLASDSRSSCATFRADDHANAVESGILAWCAQREAAELLSLPDASNSPSHRRLLHTIDRIAARAPRTSRAQVAALASTARTRIAHLRGAGGERLLDSLLGAAPTVGVPSMGAPSIGAPSTGARYTEMRDTEMRDTEMRDTEMRDTEMRGTEMRGTEMRGVEMHGIGERGTGGRSDIDAALRWLESVCSALLEAAPVQSVDELSPATGRYVVLHGMLTLLPVDAPR